MSKHASSEQILEREHPAVQAWLRLRPGSPEPREVVLLKDTSRSTVCRLEWTGPGGSSIVAKRCCRSDADREAFIYNEILGVLPLESLHCYGFVEDGEGDFGWLFLEDGGTAPVISKNENFPVAVAHWLGVLHASSSGIVSRESLPDRGPAWYLECLRFARLQINEGIRERKLVDEDRSGVETLLALFDLLEQNWDQVEECCDGLPWTLVHCDLQPKNILTRSTPLGTAFLPVDWELAGWGPPAADLAGMDAVSYRSAVQEIWPRVELRHVEEQACCGVLFKKLLAVNWETVRLASGATGKAARRLRIYAPLLKASTLALGLKV